MLHRVSSLTALLVWPTLVGLTLASASCTVGDNEAPDPWPLYHACLDACASWDVCDAPCGTCASSCESASVDYPGCESEAAALFRCIAEQTWYCGPAGPTPTEDCSDRVLALRQCLDGAPP